MLVSGSDFTPINGALSLSLRGLDPAEGGTAPRWLRFGETTGRLRVMFPDVQVLGGCF